MVQAPSVYRFLLAFLLCASLCGCADHARMTGLFHWTPDPGYEWTTPKDWSLDTKWIPGRAYPGKSHIIAANAEGAWAPTAGYGWNDGEKTVEGLTSTRTDPTTSNVSWRASLPNSSHPHILSTDHEGYWSAVKGYRFKNSQTLDTAWTPGDPDPDKAHQVAGLQEGAWIVEPGYVVNSGFFGGTFWTPGTVHTFYPCMKAASAERMWMPIDGYHLESANGQSTLVQNEKQTDWGNVISDVFIGLIAYGASQPQKDDGLPAAIGRPLSGEVSKAAFRAASSELGSGTLGSCNGVTLASMGMSSH